MISIKLKRITLGQENIELIKDLAINTTFSNVPLNQFVINLVITMILSLILSKVYIKFGRSMSNRKDFSYSFSLVSMTTMLIITIVKSSLALSLGLVGALSIVRFRTAIKEPEELSYLFLSIALGLGFGANQVLITILGFIIITLFIIYRSRRIYKTKNDNIMNLIISHPNNSDFVMSEMLDIISQYCSSINLKRLSKEETSVESSLMIQLSSYDDLLQIESSLSSKYPNIRINFLDNNGLFND